MSTTQLLRLALPLVKTHGFTRQALAHSVLNLPPPQTHSSPLSDAAISALFGHGSDAQRSLVSCFFDQGIDHMRSHAHLLSTQEHGQQPQPQHPSVKVFLEERLKFNEPVLPHLPEAFALLASGSTIKLGAGVSQLLPIDPLPALEHALRIADEACHLSGDASTELSWYARRASLAAIYTAAELHQITSPHTASQFLGSLLETSSNLKKTLDEVGLFSSYVFKSWKGIIKSTSGL